MRSDQVRALVTKEYPALEVEPLGIHAACRERIVFFERSSRGNVKTVRAFGNPVDTAPTIENLRAAIEQGLTAQIQHHQKRIEALNRIKRSPCAAEASAWLLTDDKSTDTSPS